jgi:hypothetical protein
MSLLFCGVDVLQLIVENLNSDDVYALMCAVHGKQPQSNVRSMRSIQIQSLCTNLVFVCEFLCRRFYRNNIYKKIAPTRLAVFKFGTVEVVNELCRHFIRTLIHTRSSEANCDKIEIASNYQSCNMSSLLVVMERTDVDNIGLLILQSRGIRRCSRLTICELVFICDNFDAFITSKLPGVDAQKLDIIPWVLRYYMHDDKGMVFYIDTCMRLLQLCKQHFKTDRKASSEFMRLFSNHKYSNRINTSMTEFMNIYVNTRTTPYIKTLQNLTQLHIPAQFIKCALKQPNHLLEVLRTTDHFVSDVTLKHLENYLTIFYAYAPREIVHIPLYEYSGNKHLSNTTQYFIQHAWEKLVDRKHHKTTQFPPYIYSMTHVLSKTSIPTVLALFTYSMKTYWKIYDKHVP